MTKLEKVEVVAAYFSVGVSFLRKGDVFVAGFWAGRASAKADLLWGKLSTASDVEHYDRACQLSRALHKACKELAP